jgi:hypothetical protein
MLRRQDAQMIEVLLRAVAKPGWFTALSLIWPMSMAWIVSTLFYQGARFLWY